MNVSRHRIAAGRFEGCYCTGARAALYRSGARSALVVGLLAIELVGGCSSGSGSDAPLAMSPGDGASAAGGASAEPMPGTAGSAPSGVGGASTSEGLPADIPVVGAGGTAPVAPAANGDELATDVRVSVHPEVNTLLVVTWNQAQPATETWLEFGFEGDNVMRSRAKPGSVGEHQDVVIGVPGETDVTLRVVSQVGGADYPTRDYTGRTGAVPSGPNGMPPATILSYDASLASPDRWLFGSVENSTGGGDFDYYRATFWLYIMDRQGRVVWYYAEPASNATYSFQRIARDGDYVWFEKRCFGCGNYAESVVKMTLDRAYFEEIPVPGLSDAIDVTDDGSLLYDANNELREMDATGAIRTIWSCRQQFGQNFQCYSNTINWDPARNTVLMSFPEPGTVVEIDRESGEMIGQYGNAPGSFAFAPPLSTPPAAWGFGFQHFPNFSAEGTLMVSSHMPGFEETSNPVANQHAFLEFSIDRERRVLTEKWRYTLGPEWPHAKGMAIRLANGNTLANYGTGGVIREITSDLQTAWHVKFDAPGANDFYNKMVGHNVLIDDLYDLNGGGPQ
jgi:hypothetical protein